MIAYLSRSSRPKPIRELLQAWGIDRDAAERRAYARLHGESLEDIARALRQP